MPDSTLAGEHLQSAIDSARQLLAMARRLTPPSHRAPEVAGLLSAAQELLPQLIDEIEFAQAALEDDALILPALSVVGSRAADRTSQDDDVRSHLTVIPIAPFVSRATPATLGQVAVARGGGRLRRGA